MVSLYRRDVYLDMMIRRIYLAFNVWVKINPNSVKAEQDGRIAFNCAEVAKELGVSLDEFKRRVNEIDIIYKLVKKKSDEDRRLEDEWEKMEMGEKQ